MKAKLLPLLALSLLFLSLPALAESETYNLPGENYNNIGLSGQLIMYVNVTLINLAPYPKFIVANPLYDFKVYRQNNGEWLVGTFNETRGEMVYQLSPETLNNTLNYRVGFWIYPYETVKVQFSITEAHKYYIKLKDYKDSCPTDVGLYILNYENGTFTGGKIHTYENLNYPICGVAYPQLLNYPLVIRFNEVLPSMDGYIKMLKYEGIVKFKLTDVPDSTDDNSTSNVEFPLFFAVSQPVIFHNATMTDYQPPYSMKYSDYLNFILGYRGFTTPKTPQNKPRNSSNGLFKLTDSLISGTKIKKPEIHAPAVKPLDFPIWVVYMGKDVNTLEISYRVEWNNYRG
ncbi:hypothetical protein [Thermococcus sp. AM4]|uniref:hypothetical protein n=1 Tax=Thermococcus sp. (strain AM4) TaxID=246969 RepID=UPI0001870A63|nr:hypothetical protein [Thermococcus sp. AM4]EEB73550.1 conserved hypothetical protein [Thermococcus sp. AM4]